MAKIVYGVSGEGSGHSSRSRVVLEHLVEAGHQVKVVTYGRGIDNLGGDFDLFETVGLHIASRENRVAPLKTLAANLRQLPDGHRNLQRLRREIFKSFQPQAVITDFEPMSAHLANHYDLPLITIDNQHRLRYMHYEVPSTLKHDRTLTVNIIRAMVPRPDVSLVTTFYFGETDNRRTFLFPPLLRSEVLEMKERSAQTDGHILVYLTNEFDSFLEMLHDFPRERFIVYGQRGSGVDKNLIFKSPSTKEFLEDLASCKAVMATAGFTLITEALFLKKPYLAMPMTGQFEQEINGVFLEALKGGMSMREVNPADIGNFLYRLPEMKRVLGTLPRFENRPLLDKLDELLAGNGDLAGWYHRNRKHNSHL